ncbi:MAG: hypothetical protein KY447_01805 [Actinobacteria bacterium]|nr:hypothetical protein [Actinomycetota bacterium]MBW3641633.1 hypothetical protein [Actinomycetota bacterium]
MAEHFPPGARHGAGAGRGRAHLGTILLKLDCPGCGPPPLSAALLVAGQTLPLALRRRAPVAVWLGTGLVAAHDRTPVPA